MFRSPVAAALLCLALILPSRHPRAWDAAGHRTVTCLALAGSDLSAATWLGEAGVRERLLFQSGQLDRVRGWEGAALRHVNEPDHYLELDSLGRHGLAPDTLPPLRRRYLRFIILHAAPATERNTSPQYLLAGPGFLAHALAENREWLAAALQQEAILAALADPRRAAQRRQSRADVIHALGRLSHLVADGAQPLHTTRHFNGWSGDNPRGFTTSKSFHRQVDSRPGQDPRLSCAALLPRMARVRPLPGGRTWPAILSYLQQTFARVEGLYQLEKEGRLQQAAGSEFMAERLLAGAGMLAGMLQGALADSRPGPAEIRRFLRSTPVPDVPAMAEPAPVFRVAPLLSRATVRE